MNTMKRFWKMMAVAVPLILALLWATLLSGIARAEQPAPIILNPDGTAAESAPIAAGNFDEPTTQGYINALNTKFYIYVSAPGSGKAGGIAYDDEDVMRYDTANGQWIKAFDGTNAGLSSAADIDALDYRQSQPLVHEFYLSFDKPVNVPGLGQVDDSDVVLYSTFLGGSSWTMYFDGSQYGLTTSAEDVDAFDYVPNGGRFSTTGGFTVPRYGGGDLTGADEDVLSFNFASGNFSMYLDGSTVGFAAGNDVRGFDWDNDSTYEWLFLSMEDPFTFTRSSATTSGAPNDIMVEEKGNYGITNGAATLWDASAAGFPKVDAIELVKHY